MSLLEGVRSPEKRKGRVTLSVRDPWIEKLLAGLAIDYHHLDAARAFGKWLWVERNRFDINRRLRFGPGMFGGALSKSDAARALKTALAGEVSA